jgi:CubicO group peptidase (beta-lactamase class C family)
MKPLRPCLLAALVALAYATGAPAQTLWPTAGWTTSPPEEQGLSGPALEKLSAELAGETHGYIDGLLVIRRGRIVFERSYVRDYERAFATAPDRTRDPYNYYDPAWHPYYKGTSLHTLQSVSKSVTATLIGIAIRRGEIQGTDAPALPYFEGYTVADDVRRQRWKLKHLLTMTAGIAWDETTVPYTDPKNSCAAMERSRDWVQFVLDQPLAAEPGSQFVYNSGVTELLAQVLKKATGKHADEYAAAELFQPLGITNSYWKRTPTGHPDTEGGLYLTPRDLAKIGYLHLHDGAWNGRQILPPGWAREATRAQVTNLGRPGRTYGYQWWQTTGQDRPANFLASGYGGQYLIVVPSLDLIAVFTGWNIYDDRSLSPALALDRILAAVKNE